MPGRPRCALALYVAVRDGETSWPSAGNVGTIEIWDPTRPRSYAEFRTSHVAAVWALTGWRSDNGDWLCLLGPSGVVRLWNSRRAVNGEIEPATVPGGVALVNWAVPETPNRYWYIDGRNQHLGRRTLRPIGEADCRALRVSALLSDDTGGTTTPCFNRG